MYGMTKVLAFRMTSGVLRARIAQTASDSARVVITDHAKKRMKQRKITRTQIQDVLLFGKVVEAAYPNPKGDWCCTLERLTAGDLVTIPVCLSIDELGEAVIVITVMN